jgi:predicted enzyme related to lactoylglutathione lyase
LDDDPKIKLYSFTLDCKDPHELAKFYAALLRWETGSHDEEYAWIYPPGTKHGAYPCILFQRNPEYMPPVWPDKPEAQQQMAHMDFAVDDLEKSIQHAVLCGATIADAQFSEDWKVMFGPAGHPFCLCLMKSIFESGHFALM